MRVAIVGGGWAGLAAAVELTQAGSEVTLYEAAKQLGGRARRVDLHGQRLDNGQHLLVGAYRETQRLMRVVGADPARLLARQALELSFPRALPSPFHLRLPHWPAPWHLAVGLFRARGVRLADKLTAARWLRALQARDYRLDDDGTVAALLDRQGQRGPLRRYLWEALCLAALNTPPEDASAQIFANVLRDSLGGERAATDLLLPTVDLDGLFPRAAAAFVTAHGGRIRLSTRIRRIEESLGVAGECFDAVVLAVAPQHAVALLAQHPASLPQAQSLATYRYEPIATAYCAYPPQVRLPLPMLGLAAPGEPAVGQWVFDRGALGGSAGLLAFVLSGHGAWEGLDDKALIATLHRELSVALGIRLPAIGWSRVIRERRASFSCRPHLPRPSPATARAGLWLAGDYVCAEYPATLEGAVRSGVAAAAGIRRG